MPNPYDLSGVKIDGVIIDSVRTGARNGEYILTTRGTCVNAEGIEAIDWDQPTIENLSLHFRCQLPQGYGYVKDSADYSLERDQWVIKVHVARQYLGDVSQYENRIADLNSTIQSKDAALTAKNQELSAKNQEIESLNSQLTEADEALIAMFEAQENESAENTPTDTPVTDNETETPGSNEQTTPPEDTNDVSSEDNSGAEVPTTPSNGDEATEPTDTPVTDNGEENA